MSVEISKKHEDRIWMLVVFILALFVRMIYLLQVKANPHFFSPTMDPLYHDVWGQNIAGGNLIGGKVFFRAPFYAYFLAGVYKLFGHNYIIPRLIQHLVGSLSCVLIYSLGKKLFNRQVAIISGLLAAAYGMFWYYEDELLLDSLLVFFDLLLIWLLLQAREKPKFSSWFMAGVILGFSAITRPNILFFVPFVWLWIFLIFRKGKPFKQVAVYGAAFLMGGILIISPVALRNLLVGKDLVLVASQGGINFYIGNNRNSDGMSAIFYKEDWQYRDFQQTAEKETGRSLKPSEISNYYYRKGIDFFLQYPTQAFKLLIKKLYLFWNRFEISNNQDIYFFRRYSSLIRITPLGFWLIAPLGLVGMLLSLVSVGNSKGNKIGHALNSKSNIALPRLSWDRLLPILFIFSYMITVVIFFVTARFRIPVIPFLIIFSGFALFWVFKKIVKRDISAVGLFLFLLFPLLVLSNSNAYHLKATNFSQAYFSLGNLYLKQGKLDLALAEYDSTLMTNPRMSRAHLNRGIVFFEKGEYGKAEGEYLTELRLYPDEDKAYNNLSALYRQEGQYAKAAEMAQKALQIRSYYPEAYMNLALSYRETGEGQKAKEILKHGIDNVQPFLEGELLLGEIFQAEGEFDSAIAVYEKVIQPASRSKDVAYDLEVLASQGTSAELDDKGTQAQAHFNLGTIYAQRGELDLAEYHLKSAFSLKPDFADAFANLGMLYDYTRQGREAIPLLLKAISLDPQNAVYHYNLGLVYAKQMDFKAAQAQFQTALQLDPTLTDASEKLRLVDSLIQIESHTP
ncbi:MAG TPA: tetratricopeptide repeat protein [candidate division Zixibacteria bacterium]